MPLIVTAIFSENAAWFHGGLSGSDALNGSGYGGGLPRKRLLLCEGLLPRKRLLLRKRLLPCQFLPIGEPPLFVELIGGVKLLPRIEALLPVELGLPVDGPLPVE